MYRAIENLAVNDSVALKLLKESDAEKLFNLLDNDREHLREWLPWVDSSASVESTLDFLRSSVRQNQEKNGFNCGIYVSGELSGVIGLHYVDHVNRITSIGYWLSSKFCGRGIMTSCCRAVVDHCFDVLVMNRIEIRCATGNKLSRRVPEKLKFTEEGILREAEWLNGWYVDLVVYSLLLKEWEGRR